MKKIICNLSLTAGFKTLLVSMFMVSLWCLPAQNGEAQTLSLVTEQGIETEITLSIKIGETGFFYLSDLPSAAYSWACEDMPKEIDLKVVETLVGNCDPYLLGKSSVREYGVSANAPGDYFLLFRYKQPWAEDSPQDKLTLIRLRVR